MSPLIKMFVSRLKKIYKGASVKMKNIIENINQWEVGEMLGGKVLQPESFSVICK